MELQNQNNIVKAELTKLYEMLITKVDQLEKIKAPKSDIRRIINQQFSVETMLKNYFDFDNCNQNNEILLACKLEK